jgi:hypothetical protein
MSWLGFVKCGSKSNKPKCSSQQLDADHAELSFRIRYGVREVCTSYMTDQSRGAFPIMFDGTELSQIGVGRETLWSVTESGLHGGKHR